MKKLTQLFFFVAIMPLILGMSSFNGASSPDKIPVPEKKFKVTFIDQMDVLTECRNASIDGNTFVEGKIGNGNYTISFDKIDHILFLSKSDNLFANIKLIDGNIIDLNVNKSAKAFGLTRHGTFQIRLLDIKKLIIEGTVK